MLTKIETILLNDHSLALSTVLHLVPGILIVTVYWYIGLPIAESIGYPSLFGLLIAGVFVLLPWEYGILIYLGIRRNQKWSFDGVVLFRNRLSKLKLVVIVVGLFIWALAVVGGLSFIDSYIQEGLFYWVPDRFELNGFNPTEYSITIFSVATIVNLLMLGIAVSFIEEIYFRGFLLPRMSRMGQSAPIVNSVLFVLYHFWSPWQAVTRILFLFPLVWFVWRRRSIEVGIWTHCLLNSVGILLTYGLLMAEHAQ